MRDVLASHPAPLTGLRLDADCLSVGASPYFVTSVSPTTANAIATPPPLLWVPCRAHNHRLGFRGGLTAAMRFAFAAVCCA